MPMILYLYKYTKTSGICPLIFWQPLTGLKTKHIADHFFGQQSTKQSMWIYTYVMKGEESGAPFTALTCVVGKLEMNRMSAKHMYNAKLATPIHTHVNVLGNKHA